MNSEKIIRRCTKTISENLKFRPSSQLLVHNISKLHDTADALALARLRDPLPPLFECQKGCTHCCSLRVEALPPELFRIAKHVNDQTAEVRTQILDTLHKSANYAKGKTFKEYSQPCAFLTEQGVCSIYSVRPYKCRQYFSMSLSDCISKNAALEDIELHEAENNLVVEVIEAYKKKNLVIHPFELAQGVLQVLEDQSIIDRWAKGEQVFELLPERIVL